MEPEVIQSQVDQLKVEAPQVDNSEVQARVQRLIGLIKKSLRSQTLTPKTQKELARLLSLAPSLKDHHIQQLDLLDLAVSLLTEANEPNGIQTLAGSTAANTASNGEPKNLVFVQEARRQIDRQSRTYPNVVRAMFTGNGTPYIRLVSGLSWFFLVFVLLPLGLLCTTLVVREAARDIADYTEAKQTAAQLTRKNQDLLSINEQLIAEKEKLENRNQALTAQLGTTESQLSNLSEQFVVTSEAAAAQNVGVPARQVTVTLGALEDITRDISAELRVNDQTNRELVAPSPSDTSSVSGGEAVAGASERLDNSTAGIEGQTAEGGGVVDDAPVAAASNSSLSANIRDTTAETIATVDDLITNRFSLILLAISMGALGSTISVIVRADTFIQQAQESENDLFLTGFFRPFVGMSFAIFCVALVEAGIFAGLFDIKNREDADKAYFYVAIAFVAGFSERLVRDVVIKTEDTLAGPKPK